MRSFISALCFLITGTVSAQQVIISGKPGNRPLVWSDFSGTPDDSNPFSAMTWWSLNYSTSNVTITDGTVNIGSFNVVLELDPKYSWVKKDKGTDDLLRHEQGHFYLALMCMKELLAKEKEQTFTKNSLNRQVQSLFEDVMKKYRDLEVKYDKETDHSKNKEEQEKWNEYFNEQPGLTNN